MSLILRTLRNEFLRMGALVLLLCGTGTLQAAENPLFAAWTPGGSVHALLLLKIAQFPAGGLRVEDDHGTVLIARLQPDATQQARLDALALRSLDQLFAHRLQVPAGAKPGAVDMMFDLRLVSDWTFARAAGLGFELPAGVHPHAIKVVLLGADGMPAGPGYSATVGNDPGPLPLTDLRARAGARGVTLSWRTPARARVVSAYAYTVTRGVSGHQDLLTPEPVLLSLGKTGRPYPYVDGQPPVATAVSYSLRMVDLLGVPGPAAVTQVYSPDFEALRPPAGQHAEAGRGRVSLTWSRVSDVRTTHLVVERAQLAAGPYEILTPAGLDPKTDRFVDTHIFPGAIYYYRVRAVGPNGELGPAPDPVSAQPVGSGILASPQHLAAQVGISQIALHWDAVPVSSVAGYIVERRAEGAVRWTRLNALLAPAPRYLDVIAPAAGGRFEYRVIAVATDERRSAPGTALVVKLRDAVAPPAPVVTAASGADDRVQLHFVPGDPAPRTAQVVLLRSDSAQDQGLVIGVPVAGSAGVVADTWVHAGQHYWYRLVALDTRGNRSRASPPVEVRVGALVLAAPPAPQVTYRAQPSPQVELRFQAPPAHAMAIVQAQLADGRWAPVAGPAAMSTAIDRNPSQPLSAYRVRYVGEDGSIGPPSPVVQPQTSH